MGFVKFSSTETRLTFNAAQVGMPGAKSYMNPDLPIRERVAKKFLVDFKNLWVNWGHSKSSIHFDDVSMVLSVGGAPILKPVVSEYKFNIEWIDPAWAQWTELVQDSKFVEITAVAQNKLNEASKRMDK